MKILIVVDMQNDFIDGALGTKEAEQIVPAVKAKIDEYLKSGDKVIYTRDTHTENYLNTQEGRLLPMVHCVKGTFGWEIAKSVFAPECKVIDKPSFGSLKLPQVIKCIQGKNSGDEYFTPDMEASADSHDKIETNPGNSESARESSPGNIDLIELIGLCTDICVISNAMILKAAFPEVPIKVDSSCCAGVTPESHENALSAMRMCQIEII